MDTKELEKYTSKITVRNMENEDVEVVNYSPLTMMGKGRQGAVFQYSDDICIKIFGNEEDCEREHYALSLGQQTDLFPKVYAKGPLYIAMEIIRGVDLREYLQSQPLTEELSMKLIDLLVTFKEIGYERIDHHKRQIFILPEGNLKVIDVARTVWRDRVYPYPRKLLTSLGKENKEIFLSHVQALHPELYSEWTHYIEMEEQARQICQKIMTESTDKETLKNKSKKLLTTNEQKIYTGQLESLVHKVFKEEWVKAMLVQGYDPDKVMDTIEQHMEKLTSKETLKEKESKNTDTEKTEEDVKSKNKNNKEEKYSDKDGFLGYRNKGRISENDRYYGFRNERYSEYPIKEKENKNKNYGRKGKKNRR
ncbi:hypothetical protein [Niallia endozanthoxylica]|uniref:Protein kinase domain-containing protein n=1 Tax=Niallia endozanthoxylica TaxID=2036016 RepID=A0A5J5I9E9_9BACI|nr:hypothetical protein [Niallia endozanthoxylica]KAA9031593.1 hypothetical protein F4V44_00675 [Niallia endozanthoxylica]